MTKATSKLRKTMGYVGVAVGLATFVLTGFRLKVITHVGSTGEWLDTAGRPLDEGATLAFTLFVVGLAISALLMWVGFRKVKVS